MRPASVFQRLPSAERPPHRRQKLGSTAKTGAADFCRSLSEVAVVARLRSLAGDSLCLILRMFSDIDSTLELRTHAVSSFHTKPVACGLVSFWLGFVCCLCPDGFLSGRTRKTRRRFFFPIYVHRERHSRPLDSTYLVTRLLRSAASCPLSTSLLTPSVNYTGLCSLQALCSLS